MSTRKKRKGLVYKGCVTGVWKGAEGVHLQNLPKNVKVIRDKKPTLFSWNSDDL